MDDSSGLELATERLLRLRSQCRDGGQYNQAGPVVYPEIAGERPDEPEPIRVIRRQRADECMVINAYLDQQSPVVEDWPKEPGWWWRIP